MAIINNWEFVEGSDDRFDRQRWTGRSYSSNGEELEAWFQEQNAIHDVDYDLSYRFNSGDPTFYFSIYNESLGICIALAWT